MQKLLLRCWEKSSLKRSVFLIATVSAFHSNGQLTTEADFKRTVQTDEYSFGLMLHTRGYGVNFRRMYYLDGFNKQGWEIDMVNLRHEKEVNIYNPFDNSARGFVYGKLNTLYSIRAGYILDKILVDKTDRGTISIDMVYGGGLSLGLLKPVYLEIYEPVGGGSFILSTERYDPEIHDYLDIYGRSSFFTGFGEMKMHPGIYGKLGVAFDFDILDNKVTTLETGVIADFFFDDAPIMYIPANNEENISNHRLFIQVYLTFNFGNKWN